MRNINIIVGCEFSGSIRNAFRELGFNAWSCDILECDDSSQFHYQMDIFEAIKKQDWDLAIFHPPCTYMAVSGARWMYNKDGSINEERKKNQDEALNFVIKLMDAPIRHIAIENPISVISSRIRKPDQVVQPWWFGCPAFKATCLWLKDLPLLIPTNKLTPPAKGTQEYKDWSAIHRAPPSKDRAKIRSKTFPGLAQAMAQQYSEYILNHG